MAITAGMVKELREMTGAGMMDCKKALTATEGNMDAAVDWLREKGLASAQKKAGRIAAEGIVDICASEDGHKAVAVEVNAETDFVAKNEKFRSYVADVAAQALKTTAADIEGFLAGDVGEGSVSDGKGGPGFPDRGYRREHEHPPFPVRWRSRTVSWLPTSMRAARSACWLTWRQTWSTTPSRRWVRTWLCRRQP